MVLVSARCVCLPVVSWSILNERRSKLESGNQDAAGFCGFSATRQKPPK
jgi:hypothetical protein